MQRNSVGRLPASDTARTIRPARRSRRLSVVQTGTSPRARGQALVEFALVIPIFLVMLMALIEFTFLMNGQLSISFATRDASLVGAEAGNGVGADCVILKQVQNDVAPPANRANITKVLIYRTNDTGQPMDTSGAVTTFGSATQAVNVYIPGSTKCDYPDGTSLTVPFVIQGGIENYPGSARCNAIRGTAQGCQAGHPGLDSIGVQVTYHDSWKTPLSTFIGLSGSGWTLVQSNQMRMEPVL